MATRDELHKLIDSLPDGAISQAGLGLELLQSWPERPSPQQLQEQIRKVVAERWKERKGSAVPNYALGASLGAFGLAYGSKLPATLPGGNTFGYRDGDTYVLDTKLYHEGHMLKTTERLRVDRESGKLFYSFDVTGPDGQFERHDFSFEVK